MCPICGASLEHPAADLPHAASTPKSSSEAAVAEEAAKPGGIEPEPRRGRVWKLVGLAFILGGFVLGLSGVDWWSSDMEEAEAQRLKMEGRSDPRWMRPFSKDDFDRWARENARSKGVGSTGTAVAGVLLALVGAGLVGLGLRPWQAPPLRAQASVPFSASSQRPVLVARIGSSLARAAVDERAPPPPAKIAMGSNRTLVVAGSLVLFGAIAVTWTGLASAGADAGLADAQNMSWAVPGQARARAAQAARAWLSFGTFFGLTGLGMIGLGLRPRPIEKR
jgi:hypothetical protein